MLSDIEIFENMGKEELERLLDRKGENGVARMFNIPLERVYLKKQEFKIKRREARVSQKRYDGTRKTIWDVFDEEFKRERKLRAKAM